MKLAVGYQQTRTLTEAVRRHASDIDEVYFAWSGEPSGRMPLGLAARIGLPEVQERLEADLSVFRGLGLRLNLLFNASCYGEWAVSEALARRVCAQVGYLNDRFGLGVVTTCSPMIAALVKENVDQVKLATRMHKDPAQVIGAYAGGSFAGDLLDLLEPGHGPMLGGRWIDNSRFPADWFAVTSTCRRDCQACGYCAQTLKTVLRERSDATASEAVEVCRQRLAAAPDPRC